MSSADRSVLAPDLADVVAKAGVDPTFEGRALSDALRSAIPSHRSYCSLTEERNLCSRTLAKGLARCIDPHMTPESGIETFVLRRWFQPPTSGTQQVFGLRHEKRPQCVGATFRLLVPDALARIHTFHSRSGAVVDDKGEKARSCVDRVLPRSIEPHPQLLEQRPQTAARSSLPVS